MPTSPVTLEPKQVDFLYWHGVSKMRMADFEGANTLFRLLHAACPERTDTALGRVYCLVRLGELEAASSVVAALRRHPLRPDEMALLGRLHRRCEIERARSAARQRLGAVRFFVCRADLNDGAADGFEVGVGHTPHIPSHSL